MAQTDNGNSPTDIYQTIPFAGPLDLSTYPGKGPRSLLQQANNVVYRRINALGKRTGSTVLGPITPGISFQAGYRWTRGVPSVFPVTILQQLNTATGVSSLVTINDVTGVLTPIPGGVLPVGAKPAYFAATYDPNVNSDIVVITYGSGPPLKWDGTNPIVALNAVITNQFSGCHFWHEHVWFWGDPNFPDTVYASDLSNPESFAFSNTYGGYQQGRGDGDTMVTRIADTGNNLYVFKHRSIYQIQGYDFVQGDYQFSDVPIINGIGTPSGQSVAALRSAALIFWSGVQFFTLTDGATAVVAIGTPLMDLNAAAAFAAYPQNFQAVCGDFLVQGPRGRIVYNDFYMCAVDVNGTGIADTIVVFDEYATSVASDGVPRWTTFSGLPVGAFVAYGGAADQKLLYIASAVTGQYSLFGGSASSDNNEPIPVTLQLLRDDSGTPDQIKHVDRTWLDVESNTTTFVVIIMADSATYAPDATDVSMSDALVTAGTPQALFGSAVFGVDVFGGPNGARYQSANGSFNGGEYPAGRNLTFTITESSATSVYELVNLNYHAIQEAHDR